MNIAIRLAMGLVLTLLSSVAQAADLAEARLRWLRGNYAEARALFADLTKQEATRVAALVGLSRAWQSEGKLDKANAVLESALKDAKQPHPDLLAEKADLCYQLGDWENALKQANAAIAGQSDHFLARWVKARILRDRGDLQGADQAMRWFVRTYTQRNFNDQPIVDAEDLILISQAAAENARWHQLSDQFSFILNEVIADALKAEPDYWPAEWLAGMMLLEKFNRPAALKAFNKALQINPRATEALIGKGLAALQTLEFKAAEQFANTALAINPHHSAALRLQADIQLAAGELDQARKLLKEARTVNPRDTKTLARIAACHYLQRDQQALAALVAQVDQFDKKPSTFYFELAEALENRRVFTAAQQFYEKALAARPFLPDARCNLGLLYLRLGNEPKAREFLTQAFRADPFHVRVANSLKVLRHLEQYETLNTDHFAIRYDPNQDTSLARVLADYLEDEYAHLERQFSYAPNEKILVEVFNNHEMFSGRTVALPDLHTIGACTGKVITMVSPHAKGIREPFNWGRVVRHELVHIFNLAQTEFMVPHWLTEGLAVRNEKFARPDAWMIILRDRLEKDQLLNLDTIVLAFVRPRSPEEWSLAYCQSNLYVDFLIKEYGEGVIARLLAAFAKDPDPKRVLGSVCGTPLPDFEKRYRAYLEEVVAPYRHQVGTNALKTVKQMQEALANQPDNAELAAQLAEVYRRRRQPAKASKLVDVALTSEPAHPLASVVKARLESAAGHHLTALKLLETALDKHPDDPRLIRALARQYVTLKELSKAAELLERGRRLAPTQGNWLEELAQVYLRIDRKTKLAEVLSQLIEKDAEDLESRVRLAALWLELEKPKLAAEIAKEALLIDVREVTARRILLDALQQQGEPAELEQVRGWFAK